MCFDVDPRGRGCPSCKLGVEDRGNAIRTLGGICRGRIEQAKIARMSAVDHTVFQLRDPPAESLRERNWPLEVEGGELFLELGDIKGWYYRPAPDAIICIGQRA